MDHQLTFKKTLNSIGPNIFVFCLPIVLYLTILFVEHDQSGEYKWRDATYKSLVFFGGICLVTIPGFLLHFNYYLHDKGANLILEKKYFELSKGQEICRINLHDIVKVERHSLVWRRIPWKTYGYVKVQLKNGSSLIWTSLLLDLLSSKNYFLANRISVEEEDDFFPWLNGC